MLKSTQILIFSLHFFNVASSFNIKDRKPMVIHDMMMEGTVFQIFLFRPKFLFNVT